MALKENYEIDFTYLDDTGGSTSRNVVEDLETVMLLLNVWVKQVEQRNFELEEVTIKKVIG